MPAVECLNCGGLTNTAFADWLNCKKNKGASPWPKYANRCYQKWVDGEWVPGCAADEMAPEQATLARKLNEKSRREKRGRK